MTHEERGKEIRSVEQRQYSPEPSVLRSNNPDPIAKEAEEALLWGSFINRLKCAVRENLGLRKMQGREAKADTKKE